MPRNQIVRHHYKMVTIECATMLHQWLNVHAINVSEVVQMKGMDIDRQIASQVQQTFVAKTW